jgi:hypothetical protein
MPTLQEEPLVATPVAPTFVPVADSPSARTLPDPDAPHAPSRWTLRLGTGACFGISALTSVAVLPLGALGLPYLLVRIVGSVGIALFVASTVVAAMRTLRALYVLARDRRGLVPVLTNLVWTTFGTYVAYLSSFGFSRGRQLRRFGRVLLPRLQGHAGWTGAGLGAIDGADAPAGLADQWRENAKTEHASVAAFARLTLDLMALGAPSRLVADSNRDALDEIRHAELCFALARALDGRDVGPAPFPEAQRVGTLPRVRAAALAQLAVDSLVDGALHEGVSARVIAKLARRCQVPAIRAALVELAADEGRHAAHGWAVVEWCLAEGGAPVAGALEGALRALPVHAKASLPAAAQDGAWERWGIHGARLEAEEYAAGRAHVVERVRARLGLATGTAA